MMDNLRAYLMGAKMQQALDVSIDDISESQMKLRKEVKTTMLLGFPWQFWRQLFALGGPGYTLNRAALKVLVEKGLNETGFPK
jgi:hypothetical protein